MTTPIDVVVFKSRNNFLREIGKAVATTKIKLK